MAANVAAALARFPAAERAGVPILFTAHSIPTSMAAGCRYVPQLEESCRLVAEQAGAADWKLVYQSRSGPPTQPWLEPDICDAIRELHARGGRRLVIAPIGFISDHMEVLYDLDTEATDLCKELGVEMVRAATVGTAAPFVAMVRDLIAERAWSLPERAAIGVLPANHDVCPLDCCPAPQRPAGPPGRP
jgi:ferrochelatase